MDSILAMCVPVCVIALVSWVAHSAGKRQGKDKERARCVHIVYTALGVRMSPTAHNALICIAENQTIGEMKEALRKIE